MHFSTVHSIALSFLALSHGYGCCLTTFCAVQHTRIDFAVQQHETSRCRTDAFVLGVTVRNQVLQQILLHAPWLPAADLSDRVDTGRYDFGTDARMHKRIRNLADGRRQNICRRLLVHGLSQRYKNQGDMELVRHEVLGHVAVKAQNGQTVYAHHPAQQLHDAHFDFERMPLVAAAEILEQILAE